MKTLVSLSFLCLLSINLFAQTEYFCFDVTPNVIMTEEQLESKRDEIIAIESKKIDPATGSPYNMDNWIIDFKVKKTIKKSDSIIKVLAGNSYYVILKKEYMRMKKKAEKTGVPMYAEFTNMNSLENLIGQKFPDFNLKSLSGESMTLENLKGKPTMINLWFTTCGPCIEEMPILNKIAKSVGDKINFVAITFNSKSRVKNFLKKRKFDFNHLTGAKHLLNKVLKVSGFPTNIFLDSKGVVQKIEDVSYKVDKNGKKNFGDGKEVIELLKSLK